MEFSVNLRTVDEVGVIEISNPPVNALSQRVREQLLDCTIRAQADSQIKAIVVACTGSTFVAGADLKEFDLPLGPPHLPDVLRVIEDCIKPVVAALHGSVLGGGLELALACHMRVALDTSILGLPEVSLGLIPGAGGTQRLTRLCGHRVAVDMVIGGDRLNATQARNAGLVDSVVSADVLAAAIYEAKAMTAASKEWSRTRDRVPPENDADQLQQRVSALLSKKKGEHAPAKALEAINAALSLPFDDAMALERAMFVELRQSAQAKALRYAFFAERELAGRVRKLASVSDAPSVQEVAVIGSGTMGTGIAICLANAGISVQLIDVQDAALNKGMQVVQEYYRDAQLKGRLSEEDAAALCALIKPSNVLASVASADLVIEAVFEDMSVKRDVFRHLDDLCKPGAVLATNTSYLDVEAIANCTNRPQYVLGMHFFSPAPVMKLLEVVRTPATDKGVLASVLVLGQRLGKVTVAVGVCDGFVGNRLLAAREREAMFLLEEGATPERVDRVMRDFGFPIGPFELRDMAGVDVAWRNRQGRLAQLTERERRCDWVDKLYAAGRLGQKASAGFYRYEDGSRRAQPDAWIEDVLNQHRHALGIQVRHITDKEIEERCLFAMINEAAWLLDNNIVEKASDIDLVWLKGYGFPRHRGGLTYYADQLGLKHILKSLRSYNRDAGAELASYLGERSTFL
ncbi:3-hydroxyacyl-CoA dehydrogenase NAD-binding domain-containing protein [Pseudomonas brassicacearum]|uniref:3-hydroxybutyryl-CoA epimerase n=1 Tax=Pseudomonas brassicacearum subsp. neoaurantiaca TaxID=494916 RepID=A0A7V8UA79_9PSED|nr:3-hydroxyacyl-CoA dehydrogenase NAD-binding domain-containing protein [Pseudomonas brassicacearum]MBA1376821.1 3-hydroxybutyryl-CoA epimerase [Pseudomonas brassicacearum subsp. neoaurantiaca]